MKGGRGRADEAGEGKGAFWMVAFAVKMGAANPLYAKTRVAYIFFCFRLTF